MFRVPGLEQLSGDDLHGYGLFERGLMRLGSLKDICAMKRIRNQLGYKVENFR